MPNKETKTAVPTARAIDVKTKSSLELTFATL